MNHVARICSKTVHLSLCPASKLFYEIYGVTPTKNLVRGGRPGPHNNSHNYFLHKTREKYVTARYFAALVQAKRRHEEIDPQGPRLNEAITTKIVRLVTAEGHCIISRYEALAHAKNLHLDLVEVQRNADPPVCKIMDFHKEKYKQQLKEKDRAKSKRDMTLHKDIKEVRFTRKIEEKDLQMKANMARRLMEKGYRVKCMAMGHDDEGLGELLSRLSALIEDVACVESGPKVEKRQAFVVVRHIKFGAPKKAGSKASLSLSDQIQKAALSQPVICDTGVEHIPIHSEKDFDTGHDVLGGKSDSDSDEAEDKSFYSGCSSEVSVKINGVSMAADYSQRGTGACSPPSEVDIVNQLHQKPHMVSGTSMLHRNQGTGFRSMEQGHNDQPAYPSSGNGKPYAFERSLKRGDSKQVPPASSYGIFSASKTSETGEQRHSQECSAEANVRNPLKSNINTSKQAAGEAEKDKWGIFSHKAYAAENTASRRTEVRR